MIYNELIEQGIIREDARVDAARYGHDDDVDLTELGNATIAEETSE